MGRGLRAGFTLVETLIAVTIGSVVILLATTLFLVQNDYYNWVLERTRTQDNARSMSELVSDEVRSVPTGAVVVAEATRMVVRRPLATGVICDKFGSVHVVYIPDGTDGFETGDVSGFGLRDDDGEWTFTERSWSGMYGGTTFAAQLCHGEGADTVGARPDFYLFGDLASFSGRPTAIGDVVSFYRDLELSLATSQLDTTTWALYRGTEGGTLVEFATGVSTDAHFSYRKGDTTHVSTVTGAARDSIDGIRIHSSTESVIGSTRRGDVSVELVTQVRLRNAG